ncbi:acetyl-CoA acetyltransferase [Rhodococcus wratislaviensis]|uniref:Putative lipid-transfer protein n=1 Tax=Rhodococcus wratislaviensis NBRC 100605 TaxID=1219028 RepID=X0Q9K4_RHOWR|nr:acetyl-CoA acetyltransferase [Rhodococcus wratislaviensis]GAF47586.1 putative lipid-transfer protein [Rhodococcus wratislaviensis NBRC 100605]
MAQHSLRDRVAIVAMGCTRFGEHFGVSAEQLAVDAVNETLDSVGMKTDDVDAYWLGTYVSGISGMALARPLRIKDRPVTRVENMCATGSEALRAAVYAVASGAVDVAMAVGVEKLKDTGYAGLISPKTQDDGTRVNTSAPANFSLLAPAYKDRYEVTSETFRDAMSHVAWKNHSNGALNPRAQFRKAIDKETIARAPVVAGDLGVFDCSGVADGAAAAVIVRAEDAHKYTDKPLYIKALSLVTGSGSGIADEDYDFTTFPEVVRCAGTAYEHAGIKNPREELALAEVHDCFTPTEIVLMEDLGFSERGNAWSDVLEGTFDRDGALPVNPDGGLKSFGHPVGASGLRMIFECWLQFRGEAGERQLATTDRTMALTQNLGGAPGDCVCFIAIVGTTLSEPDQ